MSTPVESAFSTSRICTWPNRIPERSLKARYATTQSATPVATAIAACWTVAQAAPPPWWILEKNFSSPMPVARAIGDLGVGVHRERDHAVDVGRGQTRVVERVQHRLGREPQLAAAGVLGEVGGADPDDRRLAGQLTRHQAPSIVSVAVAITWSPRLLLPTTFSVIRPSSTAVTSPLNVTVS